MFTCIEWPVCHSKRCFANKTVKDYFLCLPQFRSPHPSGIIFASRRRIWGYAPNPSDKPKFRSSIAAVLSLGKSFGATRSVNCVHKRCNCVYNNQTCSGWNTTYGCGRERYGGVGVLPNCVLDTFAQTKVSCQTNDLFMILNYKKGMSVTDIPFELTISC